MRGVVRNRGLRRLELALAGSEAGDWVAIVALSVLAFDSGGAAAVGLVGLIRWLPAALAAPFTALLADRYPRRRVMLACDLVRASALAGMAALSFADAPAGPIYALAGAVAVVSTAFRPAQAAILPSLARSPDELTAANVSSSTIESVAAFAGPAIGGALVATAGAEVAFAITAGTFLWSALLVAGIPAGRPRSRPVEETAAGVVREATAGIRTIARSGRLRLLVGLFAAQTLVAGALSVLVVVVALDLLELGEGAVGSLYAALGVGGLLGAAASLTLVGRRRLTPALGAGIVLWGAPIALLVVWTGEAGALVLLGVVGLANTLVDVAGITLLQRAVADDVLARVFGVLESLALGGAALGSLAAAALVEGLGARAALIAAGAFLPVVALLAWRRLMAVDAVAPPAERELALLRGIPIFAPLPAATLEHLAGALVPVRVGADGEVFRQGEPGDRFYVIVDGEVEVMIDGETVRRQGPGEGFGEIALLRDTPRTATVLARTDLELASLDREEFVAAVSGYAASADAADALIAARLGGLRVGR